MKELLALMLTAVMALSLAACGNSDPSGDTQTTPGGTEDSSEWPSKAITLLCGYSAGGSSDLGCRYLAEALQTELGVPVIVENVPGSGSWLCWNQLLHTTAATNNITSGDGTVAKMLQKEHGCQITVVPVDGASDATTMFLAGETDILSANVGDVMEAEENSYRPIVIFAPERSEFLPDVPTSAETGVDEYVSFSARGYAYMPGVDQAIVDRMTEALSVCIIGSGLKKSRTPEGEREAPGLTWDAVKVPMIAWGIVLAYALLFYLAGYYIATGIMIAVFMRFMKQTSWKRILLIDAGYLIVIYFGFVRLLGVSLNSFGLLEQLL